MSLEQVNSENDVKIEYGKPQMLFQLVTSTSAKQISEESFVFRTIRYFLKFRWSAYQNYENSGFSFGDNIFIFFCATFRLQAKMS